MSGTLYLVATPIGNLEDITLRALRILKEVDVIACEDTRHTRKLLTRYGISKPLTSYFEHNKFVKGGILLHALRSGQDLALVSDAGTPGISDPGFNLVRAAAEEGVPIVPIPGPSAPVAALSVSGLPTDRFLFVGFLPQKEGRKRKALLALGETEATLIFFESPFRIRKTLRHVQETLGDRAAALLHEMTKVHEGIFRGRLSEIEQAISSVPEKGEWILLVSGKSE